MKVKRQLAPKLKGRLGESNCQGFLRNNDGWGDQQSYEGGCFTEILKENSIALQVRGVGTRRGEGPPWGGGKVLWDQLES